ncbi:N-acetylmuramoyl-L-alanine amidase [Sardina pilchardus]|uniref:N-acetylmuramoyl-L-alanine amidase n=1 Tax=Sardina pilchardus TaxID=27697 RepID=UPI002E14C6BE
MTISTVWLIALAWTCVNIQSAEVYQRDTDHFIQAIQKIENSGLDVSPLSIVRSLRRAVGHDDTFTQSFLGATHSDSDTGILITNSSRKIEAWSLQFLGFFDKAIHNFVTDAREERGVVLTPDGTTVALAPLLQGVEAGLKARSESRQPQGLHSLTLARALGLSFLQAFNSSSDRLGPDGCWDNVTAPMVYTLSRAPSLATDALINGGMDGAILGAHLSDATKALPKLSELLLVYYHFQLGETGLDGAPLLVSPLRRENYRKLVSPPVLEGMVLEFLADRKPSAEMKEAVKVGVQDFVLRYLDCPPMIPRCMWGAKASKGIPARLSPPLHFLYVHHTEVPSRPCLTFQQCSRDMRAMQRFHQEERGWQDIGYSFVVGSDGYMYEGRGWGRLGAHTRNHNAFGYGVAFIGNYSASLPTRHSLGLVRHRLATCGVTGHFIQANYTVQGHRQVVDTTCPGDALYSEISTWEHYGDTESPKATPS